MAFLLPPSTGQGLKNPLVTHPAHKVYYVDGQSLARRTGHDNRYRGAVDMLVLSDTAIFDSGKLVEPRAISRENRENQ